MSRNGLGSLADLARILEEATNPESHLREDRKEVKPKAVHLHRKGAPKQTRTIDPKRKAWYEKRLQEQAQRTEIKPVEGAAPAETTKDPAKTKAAAVAVGGSLLASLAAVKDAKPKTEKQKTEAWRRKPGDPVF